MEDSIDYFMQFLVLLHRQVRVWTADENQGPLMLTMVVAQAIWLGLLARGGSKIEIDEKWSYGSIQVAPR